MTISCREGFAGAGQGILSRIGSGNRWGGGGGRHVNSGGRGGRHAPQCLENAFGIGKSVTSLGICLLDEDTFLGKLAMLGQLISGWKVKHYTCNSMTSIV